MHKFVTSYPILDCNIPNKSQNFPLSGDTDNTMIFIIFNLVSIKFPFFHFYFLNMDISFEIKDANFTFSMCVNDIPLEGTLSHFFHLRISFYIMTKNG